MPSHNFAPLRGRIDSMTLESKAIANNLFADPARRQVAVYLPEGYVETTESYPLLVNLAAFTKSSLAHLGWRAFSETIPQRIERLIKEGKMGKVIVAFPDCFTALGGNQYINSTTMGHWADFLTLEMVPMLTANYRLQKGAQHRGLFGKSSGGYGALVHGMRYAENWGAVACHSGDMGFDLAYQGDFPKTLMRLYRAGGIEPFISYCLTSRKMSGEDMHVLMILAMAATYDPAPEEPYGVRLPVAYDTCELLRDRWQHWLQWDPVNMIEATQVPERLSSLQGIYIDCGSYDQYGLLFGARRLVKRLKDLQIDHVFAEFPDNHSDIDYRMDVSLPFLYQALAKNA